MDISNTFLAWLLVVISLGFSIVLQLTIYAILTKEGFGYICKHLSLWGWIFFSLTVLILTTGVLYIASLYQPDLWELLWK